MSIDDMNCSKKLLAALEIKSNLSFS